MNIEVKYDEKMDLMENLNFETICNKSKVPSLTFIFNISSSPKANDRFTSCSYLNKLVFFCEVYIHGLISDNITNASVSTDSINHLKMSGNCFSGKFLSLITNIYSFIYLHTSGTFPAVVFKIFLSTE